ncbi:unnamed protein product [Durusdinium trenchii]|uniref:Uncharacterized protein n=1 Tax=Durusdinium trenchii TaxID=1381693 RepID=A0ABP0IJA1_9DINO
MASARRPQPFVQPVANGSISLDALVDAADRVYKSLNTPSPDVFFLSPMVGNCLTLRRLGPSRQAKGASSGEAAPQLTPKLIWVPVNPLIAPPWEVVPNFTAWHSQWLKAVQAKASNNDGDLWAAMGRQFGGWHNAPCPVPLPSWRSSLAHLDGIVFMPRY